MVIVSPQDLGVVEHPFQMAFLWLINGGDPNYLLAGMDGHLEGEQPYLGDLRSP